MNISGGSDESRFNMDACMPTGASSVTGHVKKGGPVILFGKRKL